MARSPSRIERLKVLRDQLTVAAAAASPGVLPKVAAQLRATLAEIAEVEAAGKKKVSAVDDLARKRAARRANPADLPAPAGGAGDSGR